MSLNLWWSGDPAELYWMEITDRDDLGIDLTAPQTDGEGRDYWGYTLVSETQPGDVVLHWHSSWAGRPALVGWSEVTGPLGVGEIKWLARGTSGRARGRATTGPSWVMPCGGLNEFTRPITADDLARHEDELAKIREDTRLRAGGSPYFPFSFYRPGELRAAQGYLTKFPAALVAAIPELEQQLGASDQPQPSGRASTAAGRGRRWLNDPFLRKAIEMHAVRMAVDHYVSLGATDIVELGKPYDLLVRGLGPERHVEVKGSSLLVTHVELTQGEVAHANNHEPTDLFVVDGISWSRAPDGTYATSGGAARIWSDWIPAKPALMPISYLYTLPPAANDKGNPQG